MAMPGPSRPQRPGALVGRGLADRLDRQPLHLGAHRVAADPRDARVDDVPDARDGQGRLRDVGGEYDAAPGVRGEHLVLLGRREPRVERHDLGAARVSARASAVSRISRSPGRNTRMSPGPSALSSRTASTIASVWSRTIGSPSLSRPLGQLDQGPVAHLDRVRAPGHLDHRRVEVRGEPIHVDRRAGDDELEVRPAWQQPLEVAEQEVDVERPLVRLVDDDRVVAAQVAIALQLGEQDAVGHQLDPAALRRPVGEPHLVADQVAELGAQLLGDPLGHRPGRDPARLGVADHLAPEFSRAPATQLEADLRQLGGLAGAGLARQHDDLVVADRGGDVLAPLADRQLGRIGDLSCSSGHDRPILPVRWLSERGDKFQP